MQQGDFIILGKDGKSGIWINLPSVSSKMATTLILGKKTSLVKYSFHFVGLNQPDKKPVVTRTISDSFGEGSCRGCGRQVISKLLFQTVSSSQTNQSMEILKDLSSLNNFINIFQLKMETPEKIRSSTKKGHCVYSLDQKDPYFHKPSYPKSQKYLRMECLENFYQIRALPFGINMTGKRWCLYDRQGISQTMNWKSVVNRKF